MPPMITVTVEQLVGPLSDRERRFAPGLMHALGDTTLLRRAVRVAVVGSRDASPAGLARARRLAGVLARRQVVVVSGLALGIDAAAHRAAIDAGGRTVAVMPTPLDDISPRANLALFNEIATAHLALSQFAPGSVLNKGNFPARNRTMALLSHATVIVEAGEGSGTLSQGWEAIRLGRPLLLAKSLVARTDLRWPSEMLDHGAYVLEQEEDLDAVLPAAAYAPEELAF